MSITHSLSIQNGRLAFFEAKQVKDGETEEKTIQSEVKRIDLTARELVAST